MVTLEDLINAVQTLENKDFAKFLYRASNEDRTNYKEMYNALPKEMKNIALKKLKEYCIAHTKKFNNNEAFNPEIMEDIPSMSFNRQIYDTERAIARETKKLKLLQAITPMQFYEFLNTSQSHNAMGNEWRYMGRFIEARDAALVLEVFACTQIHVEEKCTIPYSPGVQSLKPVKPTDFPLYLSWAWKSKKFLKVIKGESRIRTPD